MRSGSYADLQAGTIVEFRTKVRLAQNRAIGLANYILQSADSRRAGMFRVHTFVV